MLESYSVLVFNSQVLGLKSGVGIRVKCSNFTEMVGLDSSVGI